MFACDKSVFVFVNVRKCFYLWPFCVSIVGQWTHYLINSLSFSQTHTHILRTAVLLHCSNATTGAQGLRKDIQVWLEPDLRPQKTSSCSGPTQPFALDAGVYSMFLCVHMCGLKKTLLYTFRSLSIWPNRSSVQLTGLAHLRTAGCGWG